MRNPRALLAAAVVAAVVAGGVLLAAGSGGDGEPSGPPPVVRASLTLEQAPRPDTGGQELVVSLENPQLNTPETTGGERIVQLECRDEDGQVAIRGPADWPLVEEAGFAPHIHQPVLDERVLESIRSCRLSGPGIDFNGSVDGPPPAVES